MKRFLPSLAAAVAAMAATAAVAHASPAQAAYVATPSPSRTAGPPLVVTAVTLTASTVSPDHDGLLTVHARVSGQSCRGWYRAVVEQDSFPSVTRREVGLHRTSSAPASWDPATVQDMVAHVVLPGAVSSSYSAWRLTSITADCAGESAAQDLTVNPVQPARATLTGPATARRGAVVTLTATRSVPLIRGDVTPVVWSRLSGDLTLESRPVGTTRWLAVSTVRAGTVAFRVRVAASTEYRVRAAARLVGGGWATAPGVSRVLTIRAR